MIVVWIGNTVKMQEVTDVQILLITRVKDKTKKDMLNDSMSFLFTLLT
ncbi:hypothetical protein [Peribacillus butanolivorans]|nr:hypothetical protein [Peribacillus butanolivorans]QNU04131.1 hypothetical protein GM240_09365 [Peribacillus butanolivorans]